MTEFTIAEVLPGRLNAMVKNIMGQVDTTDPNEAVRLVNSGERVVVEPGRLNPCWIRLNDTMLAVNLSATPALPFKGAKVEQHLGEGGALIEKRPDGLYVDGRKIVLCRSERQMGTKRIKGYKLREELTGKLILNGNVLDALTDNPDFLPEDWKKDENDNTLFIFFWGTIYSVSDGLLDVRYFFFSAGCGFGSTTGSAASGSSTSPPRRSQDLWWVEDLGSLILGLRPVQCTAPAGFLFNKYIAIIIFGY